MPALSFPRSSTPGTRPGEGEGRLVNAYLYQDGDTTYLRRVPGLALYSTPPFTGTFRCLGAAGGPVHDRLYVVLNTEIWVWSVTLGSWTLVTGAIGGTGRVCMAANIKDPPD